MPEKEEEEEDEEEDSHSICQKNILLSYGIRRFITMFTKTRH
jgi:hypothetical protein